LLIPVILLVLLVGSCVFLSTQVREVPTKTIETDVSAPANAR